MKRSRALASLSRDHHQALVVAQRLRHADDESAAVARAAFLAYWTTHGRVHFRLEEETLLPAYAAYGRALPPARPGGTGRPCRDVRPPNETAGPSTSSAPGY